MINVTPILITKKIVVISKSTSTRENIKTLCIQLSIYQKEKETLFAHFPCKELFYQILKLHIHVTSLVQITEFILTQNGSPS